MRRRLALVLAGALAASAAAQPLTNPGFEDGDPLRGWTFSHWQKAGGGTGRPDTRAHEGRRAALIENVFEDDARFVQIMAVKPSTWYRVSAWIRTADVDRSQVGAHLSVMGVPQAAADVRGTTGWTRVTIALRTRADQTELPLALRLGFYGSTTTGRAWFDDIAVEEAPPAAGAPVLDLSVPARASPAWALAAPALAGVLLSLLVWAAARRIPPLGGRPAFFAAGTVLAAVTGAKVALAAFSTGYPSDIATFSAWASDVFRLGPGFYRDGYFADYPPGYLYVLWVVGGLAEAWRLEPGSPAFLALLKLPAVLADLGGVVLLWKLGRESPKKVLVPLLWLLSPAAALDSSVWGQIDAVFSLALLGAFALLEFRRVTPAAALGALAVLLKPQALLAAPLAVLWLVRERPPLRTLWKPLAAFAGVALVLVLPFAWSKPPMWIFSLYAGTLASYDFASLNAANLWYLLGLNWAPASSGWLLSWNAWGWLATGAAVVALGWGVWKSRLPGRWLFAAFGLYLIVFAFSTRMHERYLFPAALLGLGAYQLVRDRRVLVAAVAAGLVAFVDMLVTLQTMLDGSSAVVSGHPLMVVSAAATLALVGWTLFLTFDLFVRGRVKLSPEPPVRTPVAGPAGEFKARSTKAGLAVAALTAVYAAAALWNLGSPVSPQRYWEPLNPGESQTFDLGTLQPLKAVQYHLGLGTGRFSLEYSVDGRNWTKGERIVNDNLFAEFRWRTVAALPARYVRISLEQGRQQLNEMALVDAAGGYAEPLAPASPLFDEPSARAAVSDSFNGMYFDEVYFARSGWEIALGREATENTHPPLGKILLAGSISVLGMTPLAWRLPGALLGIAMIPLMYLLALRLFRDRFWAWLAAFFLAADFLHLTQTRIGTVDGDVLLFVLLAYYALLRWYQSAAAGGRGEAGSLVVSGLAIGLAMATKWIGIYAAAGLAALFFGAFAALGSDWRRLHGARTLAVCLAAFVVIPLTIYVASYLPQMQAAHAGLEAVIANQSSMWNYHSQMKQTHPFSSPWYQWPLMLRPIWYYSGASAVEPGQVSTIVALGNPVVWWGGTLAFFYVAYRAVRRRTDLSAWFIVAAGLAQYLPWAVIPRKLVFLYHFFMTVPFIVLALTLALRDWGERLPPRWAKVPAGAAVLVAAALFAAYYPVLTGLAFPRGWAEGLRAIGLPVYF